MAQPQPSGQRFPRRQRLRKRSDFQRVFQRGRAVSGREFRVVICPNDLGYARLGLAVGRRVGRAHVRNRVKRYIREIFRRERARMPAAVDLVVIARAEAAELPFERFRAQLLDLMTRGRRVARERGAREGSGAT